MPHPSLWAVTVKYSPVPLLQESGGLMEIKELRELLLSPIKKGVPETLTATCISKDDSIPPV